MKKIFIIILCLCLMPGVVLAQTQVTWTRLPDNELTILSQRGETILTPDYPVPQTVQWLIETARNELGYTEERGNRTKYGIWAGDPDAEWCAEYLCWCVDQVDITHGTQLLTNVYPKYSGTNVGLRWFLKQGRYIARKGTVPDYGSQWFKGHEEAMGKNAYIPQPGDWVFFSTLASGDTTHVAMVEYCTRSQDQVYVHVLEGNRPDRVQTGRYLLTDSTILGYGTVYDLADIVLRQGQEGAKVLALQQLLCDISLLEPEYVDGKYGQHTAGAVRAFQKSCGKEPTGIANHHTQLALADYARQYYLDRPEFWAVVEDE